MEVDPVALQKRSMFEWMRLLSNPRTSNRRRDYTSRSLHFQTLEDRLPLTTVVGNFDGVPGVETATITGNSVRITSQNSNLDLQFTIGNWNQVQQVDLDGQPGNELLFTNVRSINGVGLPATATVLTARTQDVHTYQVGSPNAMQIADLDGPTRV